MIDRADCSDRLKSEPEPIFWCCAENEAFGFGAHRFSLSWICGDAMNLRAETEVDHRANTTISSGARTYP
jgi:hypothetical protein